MPICHQKGPLVSRLPCYVGCLVACPIGSLMCSLFFAFLHVACNFLIRLYVTVTLSVLIAGWRHTRTLAIPRCCHFHD